jgi:hypothetical protein
MRGAVTGEAVETGGPVLDERFRRWLRDGRGRTPSPTACGVSPSVNPAASRRGPLILRTAFIGTVRAAEPPQAGAAKVEGRRSGPALAARGGKMPR